MRGGFPAFLLAGARCLRAALSGEAARRQRDGQRAGQRAVTRSPVTRAARGQRDGQRESSAKRKTGSGQSSALQPIKSPECRHASAQKTRSNYSAKGSSEPLPTVLLSKLHTIDTTPLPHVARRSSRSSFSLRPQAANCLWALARGDRFDASVPDDARAGFLDAICARDGPLRDLVRLVPMAL